MYINYFIIYIYFEFTYVLALIIEWCVHDIDNILGNTVKKEKVDIVNLEPRKLPNGGLIALTRIINTLIPCFHVFNTLYTLNHNDTFDFH